MIRHLQRLGAGSLSIRTTILLIVLVLIIPLVGSGNKTVSAQGVDEQRLETTLLQAYFISVDNFAGPVMMGGIGVPLVPTMVPPEMLQGMMGQMAQMANFDPANMPANPGLLAAIYTSADPRLVSGVEVNPMDFGSMRWDPEGFDTTVTTLDQAMLVMKFVEWAKFFHKGFNGEAILFPTPEMEAFLSLVFTAEGMMISQFVGANLMTTNGYIKSISFENGAREVVDDTIDPFDQAVMLWALSDLMYTLKNTEEFPNLGMLAGQVATPEMMQQLMGMWDQTFELVKSHPVSNVKNRGLAIVALSWYAAAKGDQAPMNEIVATVNFLARGLGTVEVTAFEKAASIRGLIEAWRITGNVDYLNSAMDLWNELNGMWDDKAQTFAPTANATTYEYTPWDAGLIIGALSEIIAATGDEVPSGVKDEATDRFLDFFSGTIVGSGFTHLPVPTPGRSGLLVSNISYDTSDGTWTVNDSRYTTAGAQYAANEMIWIEGSLQGRLTGYPKLPSLQTAEANQPKTPSVGDFVPPAWALVALSVLGILLVGSGALLSIRRRTS